MTTESPQTRPTRLRPLTERDFEVLRYLDACHEAKYGHENGWATPMDIGGHDGSHHSTTLAKLERHGLVESKARGGWLRGSKKYRTTETGRARVREWKERR